MLDSRNLSNKMYRISDFYEKFTSNDIRVWLIDKNKKNYCYTKITNYPVSNEIDISLYKVEYK